MLADQRPSTGFGKPVNGDEPLVLPFTVTSLSKVLEEAARRGIACASTAVETTPSGIAATLIVELLRAMDEKSK